MRTNTVAMSLRNTLSVAELPSYLSGWGTLGDSFFVSRAGRISDCSQEYLVGSRAGLCLLVEAVPKESSGSLSFLFRDAIVFSAASPASLIVVSLLIRCWVSCSIFFFVHSCSCTSWSLTTLNSLSAASTIEVVSVVRRSVIASHYFVKVSAIRSARVVIFSNWEVVSACSNSSSAFTCCLSTLSSSYKVLATSYIPFWVSCCFFNSVAWDMMAAASSLSSVPCLSNSSRPCLMISLSSSSTASCGTPRVAWGGGGGRRSVRGIRPWQLVMLAGQGTNSLRNLVGISKSSGEPVRWAGWYVYRVSVTRASLSDIGSSIHSVSDWGLGRVRTTARGVICSN